jgi:hypothetical protein
VASAAPAPSGPVPRACAPATPQKYETEMSPKQTLGIPLRPMDKDIFAKIENGDFKNIDDVFPDRPYRVSMVRNALDGYIVIVRVDLNRNGKIDERWRLTKEDVERTVAPADDVKYYDDFTLRIGRWIIH